MGRFFLLTIFSLGIGTWITFVAQSDIETAEVTIQGHVSLEKETNYEGTRIEIINPVRRIFKPKPKRRITTDTYGEYCLEKINVSKGTIGEIFVQWLEQKERSTPYLRIRITKSGYLPVEILILKFPPIIHLPQIELEREDTRHQFNQFLCFDTNMKIIKNITPYKFCVKHNYFLFYPRCYHLTVETPLREASGSVILDLQLIFKPLSTTCNKELENMTPKLANQIKYFVPKAQTIETELPSILEITNAISSKTLLNKLNSLLLDSEIKQIRVIDVSYKKYKSGESS
ncbi:MAG: hypothetical protein ABH886_02290 [Candidatus Desantisbacteria bacterium]